MTDKEKKAIEDLKYILHPIELNSYTLQESEALKTILNLIEKQQKEIEELHIKLDDRETELQILTDDIKADEILYRSELIESYIPKKIIYDKLELYKDDRSIFCYDNEIHLLEMILEESENNI